MEHCRTSRRPVFAAILACALVFSSGNVPKPGVVHAQESKSSLALAQLFRATVKLSKPTDRARLDKLGIKVLNETSTTALVLVDDDQLATLARLRFEPDATNSLDTLISAQKDSSQWLATSLQPLMQQVSAVQNAQQTSLSDAATSAASVTTARATLRADVQALTQEQAVGIAASINPDSDGDGLTDAQEQWWCTDPLNVDSDNDNSSGTTNDYQEVQQARDWLANRRASPPAGGPPFAGWPMVPGDGHYSASCVDRDRDGVPDAAETWDLGLNPNNESTDGDKFDDGQELFGITPASWGLLPRTEDVTFIGTNMPSWVKASGNHPLVAAYPEPQIDVVQSSFVMKAVTTVTTEKTVSDNTEYSYSTAQTEGASSSIADTVTWNDWSEVANTTYNYNTSASSNTDQPLSARPNAMTVAPLVGLLGSAALSYGLGCADDEIKGTKSSCRIIAEKVGNTVKNVFQKVGGLQQQCVKEAEAVTQDEYGRTILRNACYGISSGYPMLNLTQNTSPMASITLSCNAAPPISQSNMTCSGTAFGIGEPSVSDISTIDAASVATQDRFSGDGTTIGIGQSVALFSPYYQLSYPATRYLDSSSTQTTGRSEGGAHTTTTTEYKEQTVTNGQQFGHTEGWSTATAVNSAHAADFWFDYTISNGGTDYLLQLCNLAFNVYIGGNTNPAYTYFVAPDVGGDGCFHNYKPGDSHTFSARTNTHAIPLNLDEMKAIDLGEPVRVVLADYSYGTDQLFYSNARGAGVQIAIEDGTADGDEAIDNYLIPTWGDGDTMQDVIGRYFPSQQDSDGNYTAIWTPEYRTDTPNWCVEPKRNSATTNQLWCKHALSTSDWWNIYLNNLGDGTAQLKDTPAAANSTALFRFNQDSDLDGYSDRTEQKLGTDPQDAASHPKPELIAGVNSLRSGNDVTATLSLLNTGFYDAYGVESVMIAPDDSISIVNNTVGGSGRVRALKSVVVGSSIKLPDPLPTNWTQSNHAQPVANGYYIGGTDRMYTFTAQESGNVSTGTLRLTWTDGAGASGSLSFGTGYLSPTPQDVGAYGVKVGLYSGSISSGEVFTVTARTPRDTFQYHINREPHSEPIVVMSYNDPQGNHRFIVPPTAANLSSPTDDLMAYSGQMWQDPGVEIVTTAPITTQSLISNPQSLTLVVNNPTGVTLSNAHLFVEFVNISGTVASEVPVTVTLPAGPSVVPVTWRTAVFSPTFQTGEDYIVMAFLTDYQGNILDTAGRPLSSFQADPKPVSAMAQADETWNFGTAKQGTLLKKSFTLANTGLLDMLTYVNPPQGVSLSQTGSRKVGPADMTTYEIALNTTSLPLGAYDQTITLRTSDADRPTRTVHVSGTVIAGTADAAGGSYRPLDVDVTVTGNQSQGTWWTYTHTLGPDPASLHPVKVYNDTYTTLWGVGKYATDFSAGTAPSDMFGDGRDGVMPSSGNLDNDNGFGVGIVNGGTAGSYYLNVTDAYGVWRVNTGDVVLIHQTQGSNAGCWEINKAVSDFNSGSASYQLAKPLQCNYYSDSGNNHAQIMRVPQYSSCDIGGTLTPLSVWNGSYGGIFAIMCTSTIYLNGAITARGNDGTRGGTNYCSGNVQGAIGYGFRGGTGTNPCPAPRIGWTGEGIIGPSIQQQSANGSGGGGGNSPNAPGGSPGGSGSHATAGSNGTGGNEGINGQGATMITGDPTLTNMTLGGGGGGAAREGANSISSGGAGGGIVVLLARNLQISGNISVDGGRGGSDQAASGRNYGGGGAGGSILIRAQTATIGPNLVSALGGSVDTSQRGSGSGGIGRIRIEYCDTLSGSTNPSASTQKLNCYITEQIESSPYNQERLNLPENVSDSRTYKVQYGRKLNFSVAASQVITMRVPAGMFSSATVQALVSGLPSDASFALDIGNTSANHWSGTVSNAGQYTSPDLAAQFNAYWASHGAPTTGTLDVPVRVYLDRAGQVLLTNLQVQTSSSALRYVRLAARTYTSDTVNLTVGGSGNALVTIAADVGDDGSIDWQSSNTTTLPRTLDTGNLTTAMNAYLTGKSGDVDVPVRFYLSPASATLTLNGFSAIPAQLPDVAVAPAGITFSAPSPVEADVLTVTATVNNATSIASSGMVASFFAVAPEWGRTYIGSAFVPALPASGNATASIRWDTTAFTGSVPVSVVLDPLSRVAEVSKANNAFTTTLNILTRPDLRVLTFTLSDAEPVVGELVTATVVVNNAGQTNAAAQTTMLYLGNPDSGGTALGSQNSPSIGGGATVTLTYTWVPTSTGQARLFAHIDQGKVVNESNRNNNDDWLDVYVGVRGPVKLDSGMAGDTAYTSARGYGYLDEGQPDQTETCGTSAYESLRRDPGGRIVYRFDNLQPGRFYHLDTTFFECDGAGRQQYVYVDGNALAGPEDLSDGRVHRLSLRLDPALYADRTISVTIVAPGIDGAVVNEVNLYDVDYRYADAGGGNDTQYTGQGKGIVGPYGWLTATTSAANTSWGSLPYQSVRISQGAGNNAVRYRFDGLSPSKQYQVQMTLWQSSGAERIQKVQIDGVDASASVNTGDYQQHLLKLDVPAGLYASDGSVIVSAVRTNAATGAFVNEIALEELTSILPPIADFSATPITGFVPLNVQFTDLSSGAITTRTWNFGDGNSSAEVNPSHLYSNAGVYTVSLAINGPGGDASLLRSNFITVSVVPSSTTVMRVAPTTAMANVGTPMTVSVDISNVTNLGSFEFVLAYNPSLVQVQAVSLAEFPGTTGRSFGPVGPTINNTAGTVSFGAMSLGGSPAGPNGSGRLAYIRLLPLTAGTSGLHLSGTQVSDIQSNPLSLVTQDGSVSISANKGDFDGDSDIDILDVQSVAYRWGTHTGDALYSAIYDMDGDGDIDILDVQYVAYRWGTHFGASMQTESIADSSLAAAQTVSMSVRPANGVIFAGQSFTTSVVISNVSDLGSFQFTLGYSPTAVQVLSVTLGTLPGSTGRTFMTLGPTISATNGTVSFGAFSLGTIPVGANGDGAVAIVSMKALTASQSSLALLEGLVGDRQANPESLVLSGTSLRIVAPKLVYLPIVVR